MTSNGDALAPRVARHLARQIAWLEAALATIDETEAALADGTPALDAVAGRAAREEAGLEHLMREHHALRREWEEGAARATPGEREAIAIASARMLALRDALRARQDAMAGALAAFVARNREEQDALGRGRSMLDRYRPGVDGTRGFLDRRG